MQERPVRDLALILSIAGAIVGIALVWAVGFVCGSFVAEGRATRDHLEEQRRSVNEIFSRNPAYAKVRIAPYHDGGWIILEGEVPTEEDKWRLTRDLTEAFGRKKAENAVSGVKFKNSIR